MTHASAVGVGMGRARGVAGRGPAPARGVRGATSAVRGAGWLCVAVAIALSVLGVIVIEGVPRPGEPSYALRHLVHLGVGLAAAALVAFPHYRWAQRASYPMLAGVIVLLVFVLIPWVPEAIVRPRNGARRWINLVVTDFQPSELAKIAYVLALASYLRFRSNFRRLTGLLLPFCLTVVPMGLVLVEPDLGTSLLFLPTLCAMLAAAGARLRHLALVLLAGAIAAPAMYPILQPHQKDRIKAMIAQVSGDPRYENDIGFQADRAMTLAGAGGLLGEGRERSAALVTHNRLPEEHNDMIFAVIACRWGLAGASAVWAAFLLLAGGGLLVAAQAKDPFGRLVPVGIVAVLFSQMAINSGMTIGLLPITGMTLPFVSYGGSSLVSTWIMIGLLLNIAVRRRRYLAPEAFEFDDEGD